MKNKPVIIMVKKHPQLDDLLKSFICLDNTDVKTKQILPNYQNRLRLAQTRMKSKSGANGKPTSSSLDMLLRLMKVSGLVCEK